MYEIVVSIKYLQSDLKNRIITFYRLHNPVKTKKKIFIAHSGISYDYYFCVGKSIFVGFIFKMICSLQVLCSITL